MSFDHDRRGQSVVVGTVILFGFLILALSVYQVQFVPAENEEIEFEHSQQVEGDFLNLRNAILQAGSTGSAQSTRIQLGERYPQRTFFLNPPPASGSLQTTDAREIRFENVSVEGDGNVKMYWDDPNSDLTFNTRSLRYRPDYNEYRGAPQLTYEHSAIAGEFDNGAVLLQSSQTVVQGGDPGNRSLSLTMLSGDVSKNGIEPKSVDLRTVSQGTRMVTVSGDSTSRIVLPTAVENETRLAKRWDRETPATVSPGPGANEIQIELNGTYPLRLAEVSVDGRATASPAYITRVSPRSVSVGDTVTAEVRDRYNNPVRGAEVTLGVDGSTESMKTGDDGRVQYVIKQGDTSVEFEILDGAKYKSVGFDVRPMSTDSGSSSDAYSLGWANPTSDNPNADLSDCSASSCTWDVGASSDLTLALRAGTSPALNGFDVEFAENNSTVGSVSPIDVETNADGEATTDFTAEENGTASVYAASGGTSDVFNLTVENVSDTALPQGQSAFNDANGNGVYDEGETTYTADEIGDENLNNVDLIIARDVITDEIDQNNLGSLIIKKDVTVETTDDKLKFEVKGGSIDVSGATLIEGDGDELKLKIKNGDGNIDIRDARLESDGEIKAEGHGGGTNELFANDNGGTESDGGTYVVDGGGNSADLLWRAIDVSNVSLEKGNLVEDQPMSRPRINHSLMFEADKSVFK